MGNQAANFTECLNQLGFVLLDIPQRKRAGWGRATTTDLPAFAQEELFQLHSKLTGRTVPTSFTTGQWDFVSSTGLHIEYDEEAHFNRYRLATLELSWSDRLPWAEQYREMSSAWESACITKASYGKYWSSNSTERMFGPSDPPGVLGTLGSSRWKQRAFYDAIKDAVALFKPGVSLARVSMYDGIGGSAAGSVLKHTPRLAQEDVSRHLTGRTLEGHRGSTVSFHPQP
ncbi:hypothetical protein [Arthrobacter sp. 260]|uniref:DUF7255 family protein n=1 Tax=Arthrobacter sp. 260 TaxID=2735314 RepID=UPI00149234CA|nr:hypothetical protein [Arthrobacter sp. 260]NOJ59734.1 hypothetical protein [Arthrobacter sp. 260]